MMTQSPKEQIWSEIKGKAHHYSTAWMGQHCVPLLSVADGVFTIHHPVYGEMLADCDKLTDYVL